MRIEQFPGLKEKRGGDVKESEDSHWSINRETVYCYFYFYFTLQKKTGLNNNTIQIL